MVGRSEAAVPQKHPHVDQPVYPFSAPDPILPVLGQVPTPVLNLIRSAFPSSLGRVPTLLKALTDSLVIRHTDKALDSMDSIESGFSDEVKTLARMIVDACKEAEDFSNSFPVELPFLDAEGLEKQV